MTLPSLYANVSLRSYDYIRYSQRDGRPEGCGMASPFSMGLNGLVSRNVAGYVKRFKVLGEWKEHEAEDYSNVGRVTDGSMMLSILIRVAIEKMLVLDSFSWELNTKMLPTVWQGLAQRVTLTHLTIRFPSLRHPRPITLVPPIPSLRSIKIYDIDPLCYADDVSLLFLEAKKLEDLKLIWSPRMRDAREPSVSLSTFFGKLIAAEHNLPVKRTVIKNLYTLESQPCNEVLDNSTLEEVTFVNSIGGAADDAGTAFFERGWRASIEQFPKLKMLRTNKITRSQSEFLGSIKGLERLYLIGPQRRSRGYNGAGDGSESDSTPFLNSPASSTNSPSNDYTTHNLKDEYLEAITKNHGKTLRHLLLMPQWRLSPDDIALIVRQCPNLEQLGLGVEYANFMNLRLLVPFLSRLTAIRLLDNPDDKAFADKMKELANERSHEQQIEGVSNHQEWKIKWMGIGDLLFEVGKMELQFGPEDGPKGAWRRSVWRRPLEAAKQVEIFGMDSLEV